MSLLGIILLSNRNEKEAPATKKKKIILIFSLSLCILASLFLLSLLALSKHVVDSTKNLILSEKDAEELENIDCILVLGCLVRPDGSLSSMLSDRVDRAIELYELGVSPKILMSGDHGQNDYDEVNAMKKYAMEQGVPSSDVFMDHAGFSTYDSIYRTKEVFGAKKIVIVTQEYHIYRALYIAESLGIDAVGIPAENNVYSGQTMRDIREICARSKDFFSALIKPLPKYLGNSIDLSGDGDVSNG